MRLKEIYEILDNQIPLRLSDELVRTYGGHDNGGILVDTGEEIQSVLFALDLSQGAIARAEKIGAKLIVTHHPCIFYPVDGVRQSDALGANLIACIKKGISVIAMHLNADAAARGVDYYLAEAAGASEKENVPKQAIAGGGYGRVFSVRRQTVKELSQTLAERLNTTAVLTYGRENVIERVASFCGAGVDSHTMRITREEGAQAIVSSDIKHNYICEALECGMGVIQLTHYASENYGFQKIYRNLKDLTGVASEYYNDGRML